MKKLVILGLLLAGLCGLFAYEWRYSGEMQDHIDRVNRDLERMADRPAYASGIMGTLETMNTEAKIAGEIMDTHEYAHTWKDEALAGKIKNAAADGVTVGEAIKSVIAAWPGSI